MDRDVLIRCVRIHSAECRYVRCACDSGKGSEDADESGDEIDGWCPYPFQPECEAYEECEDREDYRSRKHVGWALPPVENECAAQEAEQKCVTDVGRFEVHGSWFMVKFFF